MGCSSSSSSCKRIVVEKRRYLTIERSNSSLSQFLERGRRRRLDETSKTLFRRKMVKDNFFVVNPLAGIRLCNTLSFEKGHDLMESLVYDFSRKCPHRSFTVMHDVPGDSWMESFVSHDDPDWVIFTVSTFIMKVVDTKCFPYLQSSLILSYQDGLPVVWSPHVSEHITCLSLLQRCKVREKDCFCRMDERFEAAEILASARSSTKNERSPFHYVPSDVVCVIMSYL